MSTLVVLVLSAAFGHAAGHAYVYWPTSREAITPGMKGSWGYNGPKYGKLLPSKHGVGQGGAGGPPNAAAFSTFLCNKLPQGPPVVKYKSGGQVTVAVPVNGEHGGEHEFRLCTKDWSSLSSDVDKAKCLDEYLLSRSCTPDGCGCKSDKCRGSNADVNHPIIQRAKTAGAGELPTRAVEQGLHEFVFNLPEGVSCDKCVLHWFWHTAWGEQFAGCSDIAIEGAATPSPSPPSPSSRRRSPVSTRRRGEARRPPSSRRRSPPSTRRRSSKSTRRRRRSPSRSRRSSSRRRRRSARRRSERRRTRSIQTVQQMTDTGYIASVGSQFVGCYLNSGEDYKPITNSRDKFCEGGSLTRHTPSKPCRGGLPFFRREMFLSAAVDQSAVVKECFGYCTSKGLDLFGFVNQRKECRCGASIENHDFWGKWQEVAVARGLQLSTLSPSTESGTACKGVEVFQYVKWKEQKQSSGIGEDYGIALDKRSLEDIRYMRGIVEVSIEE